jgi:hypothetical protein
MNQKLCRHRRATAHTFVEPSLGPETTIEYCPGPLELKVEYDPQALIEPWVETESKNATGTVEYEQRTI